MNVPPGGEHREHVAGAAGVAGVLEHVHRRAGVDGHVIARCNHVGGHSGAELHVEEAADAEHDVGDVEGVEGGAGDQRRARVHVERAENGSAALEAAAVEVERYRGREVAAVQARDGASPGLGKRGVEREGPERQIDAPGVGEAGVDRGSGVGVVREQSVVEHATETVDVVGRAGGVAVEHASAGLDRQHRRCIGQGYITGVPIHAAEAIPGQPGQDRPAGDRGRASTPG